MIRQTVLTLIALCVLAAPALGQTTVEAPLADRLPGHTFVYLGWAGQTTAFQESVIGRALTGPDVADFMGAFYNFMLEEAADAPEDALAIEHAWAMLDIAWQHEAALAVIELGPPVAGQPGDPNMPPAEFHLQAAVLIDLGDDCDAFDEHLQELLVLSEMPLEVTTLAGESCYVLPTPAGAVTIGYLDNMFFLTVGAATPQMLVDLASETSLAMQERFNSALSEVVSDGGPQIAMYAEIDTIRTIVDTFLPPPPTQEEYERGGMRPAMPRELFNPIGIQWIWQAYGIDQATTLAGTVTMDGPAMHGRSRLFTPAPHHGMMMLYGGEPLTDADLAMVPADADYFSVFQMQPGAIYDEVMRLLQEMPFPPDEETPYQTFTQEILPELEENLGFALEEDLLDSLGGHWVLCSAPSYGGFLTGTVLIADVQDVDRLNAVIARLEAQAGGVPVEGEDVDAPTTQPVEHEVPISLAAMQVGDTSIHYISEFRSGRRGRRQPIPFAPAWAIHEGRLYVALYPQVIETVLTRTDVTPITDSADFQRVRSQLAGQPVAMEYLNTPQITRQVYNLLLLGSAALRGVDDDELDFLRHIRLPSLTAIEANLWPELSAVSVDDEGITSEWYGTVPVAGVVAGTAASAGMMANYRTQRAMRRYESMSNMWEISQAIMVYSMQFDEPPASFEVMVSEGMLPVELLWSENSGPGPFPQMVDGELVGQVGFVFVPPATMDTMDDYEVIVAYERPEYHRNQGTLVATLDGSVRWMDMQEFMEQLARTQAINAEALMQEADE